MLIDVELGALQKYLNPSKAKLESKGVESVISRVMNLKDLLGADAISHEKFCEATVEAFKAKWHGRRVNEQLLKYEDAKKVDKIMEIYEGYLKWEWRFGETP